MPTDARAIVASGVDYATCSVVFVGNDDQRS